MRFSACVEVGGDGWCTVWVGELPGFFLNEPSEAEAMDRLPDGIRAYLRWLKRHRDRINVPRAITVSVAERDVHRQGMRYGEYKSLFSTDRPPVTSAEIERAIRWMGYMRADLLRLVGSLPPVAMGWRRPPGARTVERHLRHLASGERWYLQRFPCRWQRLQRTLDPLERIHRMRRAAIDTLRALTAEERAQIVEPEPGRWWSRRKMLGRILYHERYHIRSIARIAIAHGVPVPRHLGGWDSYA